MNLFDKISSMLKRYIILVGIFFLLLPVVASADSLNQKESFFVDSSFDVSERSEITAILKTKTSKLYFYIDNKWWDSLNYLEKQEAEKALDALGEEFNQIIYPSLTSAYGTEWRPGIDYDYSITVLLHPMKKEARGYFSRADEYPRVQAPNSNMREMVYLNADYLTDSLAGSYLAHEFMHLITFNQKERIYDVEEEVWLNEARAEYAPTLAGYDDEYPGSYLHDRARIFLRYPSDPITEWQGLSQDYGALNLFFHYLVEQTNVEVLVDSLKMRSNGIESINESLKKNGFQENFSQLFTNWTIAVLVNDCSLGSEYCYKNENLKNIQVVPLINFLPLEGKITLGSNQSSKDWAGNWFKLIGGKGTLRIEFIGNPNNVFKIPYISTDSSDKNHLNYFQLDQSQIGEIVIPGFGEDVKKVIIIPSVQTKTSGFSGLESTVPFFWEAATISEREEEDGTDLKYLDKPILEMTKDELLSKISEITELLNQLRGRLAMIEGEEKEEQEKELALDCQQFDQNLYFGAKSDSRVECLQEFLKSQGSDIYPEGLVTGNFLSLTKAAVIRFQEKYTADILAPLGLEKGTGFFGPLTRQFVNKLINR